MIEYPAEQLVREPPPPLGDEGPFSLWHFSEDPGLGVFEPLVPAAAPEEPPLVWAVDNRHAPMFWFPRDCPRGCIWASSTTSAKDRERFFGQTSATRVHVMEAAWLERLRECRLYGYRLPAAGFVPSDVGGYWVSAEEVTAEERIEVGDLLARHASPGIELRITPSLWPFWNRVVGSTVEFSGIRLRNAGAQAASEIDATGTYGTAPANPSASPKE